LRKKMSAFSQIALVDSGQVDRSPARPGIGADQAAADYAVSVHRCLEIGRPFVRRNAKPGSRKGNLCDWDHSAFSYSRAAYDAFARLVDLRSRKRGSSLTLGSIFGGVAWWVRRGGTNANL
jgi:hypothetical protein